MRGAPLTPRRAVGVLVRLGNAYLRDVPYMGKEMERGGRNVAPIIKRNEDRLKKAGKEVEAVTKDIARDTRNFGKKVNKRLKQ